MGPDFAYKRFELQVIVYALQLITGFFLLWMGKTQISNPGKRPDKYGLSTLIREDPSVFGPGFGFLLGIVEILFGLMLFLPDLLNWLFNALDAFINIPPILRMTTLLTPITAGLLAVLLFLTAVYLLLFTKDKIAGVGVFIFGVLTFVLIALVKSAPYVPWVKKLFSESLFDLF